MAWIDDYVRAARDIATEAHDVSLALPRPRGDVVVAVHDHAWPTFEAFLRKHYAEGRRRVLALSMNPGRNGAVQTGIAFTDSPTARQVLPEFDRLDRRPGFLRSERVETSGQKLRAWAIDRFGSLEALYREVLFAVSCPIAVLRGLRLNNVPIAALSGSARRTIDDFYERSAALLSKAARPRGVWVLGDYAARRWERLQASDPDLGRLPTAVTFHPAAHVPNAQKFSAWSRSVASLSGLPGTPTSSAGARR